ncbi:MAG: HAD family hydrolase [Lachnospiraceae bacterium]|nr:HAD family hydrolase [Lachnospiraceae bacterium]
MIRLLVTDVDGTLVEEGGAGLNPEYYEVIEALKEKGVIFGVASGRQYASIAHMFEPVKKDMLFLCSNGTYVTCNGKDAFIDHMEPDTVQGIIEDARQIPSAILMYDTKEMTYIESGNPGFHRMLRDDYHYKFKQVPDLAQVEEGCIKLSIYCPENMEGIMGKAFLPKWQDRVKTAFAGECFLDCIRTGSNKGRALKAVQEMYQIKKEETMAFGDNLNDIEMLMEAGASFAIGNARQEVKKVAKYIAAPHWKDGALQEMKKILAE